MSRLAQCPIGTDGFLVATQSKLKRRFETTTINSLRTGKEVPFDRVVMRALA